MAFSEGVTNKCLVGKLEMHNVETVVELLALADKCAREAEAQSRTERRNTSKEPASSESSRPGNKKNKWKVVAALATEGRNNPPIGRKPVGGSQKLAPAKQGAGKWCQIHRSDRHDLTECQLVKGLVKNQQKEQGDRRRGDGDEDAPGGAGLGFQERQHAVATIFGRASAPPSWRREKLLWREVGAASPAPASVEFYPAAHRGVYPRW
jgi:hypothetical protein